MDEEGVMHLGRRVKGLVEGSELALWPSIDIAALTEEQRQDFLRRKKAVLLYLSGKSFEEIRAQCDISGSQVYRLITERCLATHSDGRLYGWRALMRNKNINGYNRQKPIVVDNWGLGTSGALGLAFC